MVAITSKLANQNVDRHGWYTRIRAVMGEREMCIADIAHELHAEKSTISARMNEMYHLGLIEKAKKKRSQTTGILAYHYKQKLQDKLFK